jgi:carbonic anhydrase
MNPHQVLQQLQEGHQRYQRQFKNKRMVSNHSLTDMDIHQPIAAIISCADARVVPEYVFDQPPGQLFVVRVAGSIVNTHVLASLEFALGVLNVSLILVLGHTQCGAVEAAVEHHFKEKASTGYLSHLIQALSPTVCAVQKGLAPHENVFREVTIQNIKKNINIIKHAQPLISSKLAKKEAQVIGAMYSIETGDLQFIEST